VTPLITAKERLTPGQFTVEDKTLYFKPPQGKSAAKLRFEAIVRENGIQFGGNLSYVVLKNFTATHVANDGYNLHGNVKHIEFYNCNATQCGDEGFSSHDTCESLVDGAVYSYCDNASTNVVTSVTTIRNAIFAYSRHTGYEMQHQAKHVLQNVIFIDNPVQLSGMGDDLQLDNVLIIRTANGPKTQAFDFACAATLRRVTVVGNSALLRYLRGPSLTMDRCLFGPGQGLWHVRLDDVTTPFTLKNVRFGSGINMEYGAKQPFKTQTIAQWLAGFTDAAKLQDTSVADMPWVADLVAGKLPATLPDGPGCSKELIEKYIAFVRDAKK
jgi:hypothetical protein